MLYNPKTGKRNEFPALCSHQFMPNNWYEINFKLPWWTEPWFWQACCKKDQKRPKGPTWSLEQDPRHVPKNHQNVGLVWFHPLNMATPLHISWFEFQSHHINDPRCMGNSTLRCYKPYIIYIFSWNKSTLLHPPHSRCFFFPDPSLPGIFRCNEVEVATRMSSRWGWLHWAFPKERSKMESLELLSLL